MVTKLSDAHKKELLELTPEDITFSKLLELNGTTSKIVDGKMKIIPPKMKVSAEFVLESGEYFNKEKIVTTVGSFIVNKKIIEKNLKDVLGYINEEINGNVLGDMDNKVTEALLTDKIAPSIMIEYLEDVQFFGMRNHNIVAGSFTMASLKPNPKIMKERERLFKENKAAIEAGDAIVGASIEQQLVKMAEEELKDDSGMDLYYAKARGSFGNNYKNTSIMRGTVPNPITGGFDVTASNFMEGIRKEEMHVFGNSVVMASYPKAIGTATSGYFSKQLMAAQQGITTDEVGSDCKTKRYIDVDITPGNRKDYLYRFIIEGDKLICLDDEVIKKYVGKSVKMRTVMYCGAPNGKMCYHCTGKLFYLLNIRNTGLTSARVASTLLNLSMKKFHDASIKLFEVDLRYLLLKESFESAITESMDIDPDELLREIAEEAEQEEEIVLENLSKIPASSKYGFYHASKEQNLGRLNAQPSNYYNTLGKVVFASQSKAFAACFGGDWNEEDASIDIIHSKTDDNYSVSDVSHIVFSYDPNRVDVYRPSSLYVVSGKFNYLSYEGDLEVVSHNDVRVVKEIKYNTWKELMEENGVKLNPMRMG